MNIHYKYDVIIVLWSLMIPKERINVGVDVALGKDDWGLYFRIGEEFGR